MKLAKCSVCGHITDGFFTWGSIFLADEFPQECVYVCGPDCMIAASANIDSGAWEMPKLRSAAGGYAHTISKPRKGYDRQPTQDEILAELLACKRATETLRA